MSLRAGHERTAGGRHDELPRSAAAHPPRAMLHGLRPPSRALVRRRYRVHVHGTEDTPAAGPVVFASNHVGVLDGPLLAMFAVRPVHALTKVEMFVGRTGRFLLASGQIPLERSGADPAAVKSCLRVLRDGGAVGIFPEGTRGDGELHTMHRGAAYLALVSGAPVVPVTMIGTRVPGGGLGSTPPRGARIDIVFGRPVTYDAVAWPRTKEQVGATTALLHEHLRAEQARALRLTGRSLPGPLPVVDDTTDHDFERDRTDHD